MVDTKRLWVREMDLDRPCAARIYDAFLGGSHNFGIEREFVEHTQAALPGITGAFRENRAFLRRTVEHLLSRGVRQFLDLGSGIPTIGPVHDVARRHASDFRVLYVDNEPLTVAHSKPLLADDPRADIIEADCRDPESILQAPETRELLDLKQPVGLLMLAVLHFVPDADYPDELVAGYRAMLAPGSYLAVSHVTGSAQPDEVRVLEELYSQSTDPLYARSPETIDDWFGNFDLVSPGICFLPEWRPDPGHVEHDSRYRIVYGGLGCKLPAPPQRIPPR